MFYHVRIILFLYFKMRFSENKNRCEWVHTFILIWDPILMRYWRGESLALGF